MNLDLRAYLADGHVFPALPLALTTQRKWDARHQQALIRYYIDAGAGGLAVAVHSTQFAIREKQIGLFKPVLRLAAQVAHEWQPKRSRPFALISGLCGLTKQAVSEACYARDLGYHAGLLSMGAWSNAPESKVLSHCRTVAREIPLIGFYLQPAVGGRVYSYRFWRDFAEIPELVAIKLAPFNRYHLLDVVRAVCAAGRNDVALYTGNDDNIIADLLTPFEFEKRKRYIVGGLLGQWGVWTERAVALLAQIKNARKETRLSAAWWTMNAQLTDANAAIFDAANGFAGCVPGIHEVLRHQGLLGSIACLDPDERLSKGQPGEIARVSAAYPWLVDDMFVLKNRSRWLD